MPQQKLTIVPVSLHPENNSSAATIPAALSSNPTCTIKTGNAEISGPPFASLNNWHLLAIKITAIVINRCGGIGIVAFS
jgi:hypothetical protein